MDWLAENRLWIAVVILFCSYAFNMGRDRRGHGTDGEKREDP